jgi:hypothetical protein
MPFYRCSLVTTVIREIPMKRSAIPRQRELFEEPPGEGVVVLPTSNREEVVQLLSKLLGEVAEAQVDHSTGAEVGDDQDQR